MDRHTVIREFKSMVNEFAEGVDPRAVFKKLQTINLSRVELMIMDSAIKSMPLEHLNKTLLLSEKDYDIMLQNLTFKLVELYQTESKFTTIGTNSTGPR